MAEENQNRDRDSRFKTICLWNSQSSRRDIREINNLMKPRRKEFWNGMP